MNGNGRQLDPNLVLAGLLVVAVLGLAGIVVVILIGGAPDQIIVRVGLVTGFTLPLVSSLGALLAALQAKRTAASAEESSSGHSEELEAARSRIAYLETRLPGRGRVDPPSRF